MNASLPRPPQGGHQIRFRSLFHEGRALSFPCDAQGHVPMDELSERARNNYLYARAVVGREFFLPEVLACERPQADDYVVRPPRGYEQSGEAAHQRH